MVKSKEVAVVGVLLYGLLLLLVGVVLGCGTWIGMLLLLLVGLLILLRLLRLLLMLLLVFRLQRHSAAILDERTRRTTIAGISTKKTRVEATQTRPDVMPAGSAVTAANQPLRVTALGMKRYSSSTRTTAVYASANAARRSTEPKPARNAATVPSVAAL